MTLRYTKPDIGQILRLGAGEDFEHLYHAVGEVVTRFRGLTSGRDPRLKQLEVHRPFWVALNALEAAYLECESYVGETENAAHEAVRRFQEGDRGRLG